MEENAWAWIFQFLGRLHPLAVHFPIGLLVVAFFLESLTLKGKRSGLREGIKWMVYIGAFAAVLSTCLGWLLQTFDEYAGELVESHQNFGIVTAVLATTAAVFLWRKDNGKSTSILPYRFALAFSVIALTITGHLGANLTHGEDFLTSVLPSNQNNYEEGETKIMLAKYTKVDSLTETQLDDLNLKVRAIFAHNCYQCHSENKQKGELVLENKAGVFRGGESGQVIVAGKPENSELFKRISLPPDADGVMPKKGKVLKKDEIALIRLWIEKGAHWSDKALKTFPEAPLALSKPELPKASNQAHPVDKLLDAYFEKKGVTWPKQTSDRVFIRRAYLDIVGLLPEPEAVNRFVNDSNNNKRAALIDSLLDDKHNYAQHWLSFWNDLLRNDYSGTGFITGGRKQITDWLYTSLMENKPYDQMVQELVNPSSQSEGFIKGIQWRGVVNASQRTEMQAAQNIGQSLMGVNVKCASCHNSFVSNLTLEQAYGFASIFADSALEMNRCDKPIGKWATPSFLYKELGAVEADSLKGRLAKLSEIMVKPENGRLYRTIANRIWQRLMGRGIVEPVDEMDNTPWYADLLDWLAADFIDSGHDLKHLIKTIMTSKAYQLSAVGYEKASLLKSANYVFEGPVVRRLSAEQFTDAVSQVIAPVYYAAAYDPKANNISHNRIWHRERKLDRDVLPEPGKRFFRYKFTLSSHPIENAQALISVDHSYVWYLNGQKVSEGNNWRKVDKLNVATLLKPGENIIAIEGTNEGNIANPAGILFSMKIVQAGKANVMVESAKREGWKSTDEQPKNKNWVNLDFDDQNWKAVRNYGSSHWDKLLHFNFEEDGRAFARASLVRQHPFMKALGRPSRENVSTSRDQQATLLQALELTNGAFFNNVLAEGAESWLTKYNKNSNELVAALYEQSLGRQPTAKEQDIMLEVLGENPDQESVQDLFWATLLLPEFQFIY